MADVFAIDLDQFFAWLTRKIEEDELDATPAAVVLQDFADENLGARVDDFCYQLIEAGGIICATGWSIGIYPIDTEDSWAYLLTVRPDNEHHGQFVQVTGLSEDLSSEETMVDVFDEVVADANRLLPAARAALDAMNPPEETLRLVAVVNDDGELACPECGNTQFGYEENTVDYRYPGGQDTAGKTVSVIQSFEASAESGDSDPGLFCDPYRSPGCGKPIDLPDGWEISYG